MSPSWQARGISASIRLFVRRRRWGRDAGATARRARLIFGAPWPYQWFRTRGLNVRPVDDAATGVRGEWLEPASVKARAGATKDAGVIFYIHGGGFVSGSAATQRPVTAALARLTGQRVFSLDYRLAPEHRYPAALDDALAAYEWLLAREGVPADSICVAGDSAGGGLVLGCLLRLRDAGLAPPACAVCFSPWTDLAGTGASVRTNDGRCAMFRTENIDEFAAAYLPTGASPRDPYASPAHADNFRKLPPLLLQVGSTELLLDDARVVHERIRAAGGASRLEIYEDLPHGWQMLDGLVPEARAALTQAASFIREHMPEARGDESKF
ncbi:MAG: epsilon-lactone hydrolase [Pyrinomonadaceae bacterium]|jgi:acetyl esterase/lipase|nr:epsilon-lactone hydrolase [Pyrinomonadaceae bacterium]